MSQHKKCLFFVCLFWKNACTHNISRFYNQISNSSTFENIRRLDIVWEYQPKQKHREKPQYKAKTLKPALTEWHRNVYFNSPQNRHKKRRSAAYVALTAKDFDPTVMALNRFAEETGFEVSTATDLRSGDQREHSKVAPFHTALLVGHHVTGDAACIAGSAKMKCNSDDFAYITVLRDPLRFAQDYFYRLTRRFDKQLKSLNYRHERPGHFSPRHISDIEAFATQKTKLLRLHNNIYRMRNQVSHFGSSLKNAMHVLRLYRFIVGFEDNLDSFLVMFRARLGWGFRSLLAMQREEVKVEHRRIFKPGLLGWPVEYVRAMNLSMPVVQDYDFINEARLLVTEQKQAFGLERLSSEVAQLRSVTSSLERLCDPRSSGSSSALDAATFAVLRLQAGLQPCGLDATTDAVVAAIRGAVNGESSSFATTSLNRGDSTGDEDRNKYFTPAAEVSSLSSEMSIKAKVDLSCSTESESVWKCMLERYDRCKSGVGPHSLCDYYDTS